MNLALVKKQFTFAKRLVVPGAAGHILRDVRVDEESAAGLEVHIGVADVGFTFAQCFHFGAMKNESGLKLFQDVIVVRSCAILRDDLFAGLLGLFTFRLLGVLRRLGHNLSFYLMTRLTWMSGTAAPPSLHAPSYRSSIAMGRKAAELAYGTG